jgi:hypothetical protein
MEGGDGVSGARCAGESGATGAGSYDPDGECRNDQPETGPADLRHRRGHHFSRLTALQKIGGTRQIAYPAVFPAEQGEVCFRPGR